ncbi:hypothetical protein BCR36DRAFT_412743 [Piromyces finnis]|uniref:Uncharacterized protein n=1 Tax=Piromyces finnis TaxID=1754191 RepID=A0A1Y1V8M6_9FUNG|nr:hypothetical protein BCR36DRAFT_412743 [Piromyces finnis]|eukprot:ORX49223.1 hypothetical protein BCR36DRAFT_412743 [Piromyces finnis]
MDQVSQYEDLSLSSIGQSKNFYPLKLLELVVIFGFIFSVICKVTNHNSILHESAIINKIYSFILSKMSGEEKGLISYADEISLYGLRSNQVDIVINNDMEKLPINHISNISPTNNIPISTPNLKLDENGNIIPDDSFLKSNPFLIPSNSVKKTVEKENPNQYPTIIVTLPNDAILPYSPKIPMDIYYREGWVDYSNPNLNDNYYNSKSARKTKTYDYNYLAPLIPKNHFSLKLQQSFILKSKAQSSSEITSKDQSLKVIPDATITITNELNTIQEQSVSTPPVVGSYYVNEDVNEYSEEYELVNHAFWWQSDTNQQTTITV